MIKDSSDKKLKWQIPHSEECIDHQFSEKNGKMYCNNKACEKCYPEPKQTKPKIRLRCQFGIHELHRWYVSKYSKCRFCGIQKETHY